jgi:uncharacterized RDD family membrane protein YckC
MAEDRSAVNRLVGALISPAVDAVDPNEVIDRVDVEALVERIDINAVLARVDVDELIDRIDINALLARVDVNALLERIDVNLLLDGADINALLADLDLETLLAGVDIDALVARVAIDALVQRINIAEVVRNIDTDDVVKRIDVEDVVKRIDVADVVRRIDVDDVVARIDVSAVVERVDIDRLVSRVDLDRQIESVDIQAIVQRAQIETMIADATTGVASATLDLARRQILGIDVLIERATDRIMRRPVRPAIRVDGKVDATGWPAGPLARSLAFFADAAFVAVLFSAGNLLVRSLFELFTNRALSDYATGGLLWFGVYMGWWFIYLWGSVTITGRTPGKALLGLRISSASGGPLSARQAAIRTLVFPFSLVLGIGFFIGLLRDDLRCLHDLIARSQVMVYWGGRRTRLPSALEDWVTRHQPDDDKLPPPGDGGGAVVDLHRSAG